MNGEEYFAIEIDCDEELLGGWVMVYRMYALYRREDGEIWREYIPGTASEDRSQCIDLLADAQLEFPELASLHRAFLTSSEVA